VARAVADLRDALRLGPERLEVVAVRELDPDDQEDLC